MRSRRPSRGVGSTGDSGVSSRMFGTLLTYLSDHESDVFIVASANDISKLPPEFARAERFDGVFFLDLPGHDERETIWQMYIRKFGLDPDQRRPQDRDWVGAEIRSCCRLAALLDVPLIEAASNIVPVAVTAGEAVERLRQWASGRCLSAERPGIYSRGRRCHRRSGAERPPQRSVHQLSRDHRLDDRSRAPPLSGDRDRFPAVSVEKSSVTLPFPIPPSTRRGESGLSITYRIALEIPGEPREVARHLHRLRPGRRGLRRLRPAAARRPGPHVRAGQPEHG